MKFNLIDRKTKIYYSEQYVKRIKLMKIYQIYPKPARSVCKNILNYFTFNGISFFPSIIISNHTNFPVLLHIIITSPTQPYYK